MDMKNIAAMLVAKQAPSQEEDPMMAFKEAKREAAKQVMYAMKGGDIDSLMMALDSYSKARENYCKREELSES
jgi:hypothetical protein